MTQHPNFLPLANALSASDSKTLQALAVGHLEVGAAFKYYLDGVDVSALVRQALDLPASVALADRFGEVALIPQAQGSLFNGIPGSLAQQLNVRGMRVPGLKVTTGMLLKVTRDNPRVAHGHLIECRNFMQRGGAAMRRVAVLTPAGSAYEVEFAYYDQLAPESIPAHLPDSQVDRAWAGRATADLDRLRMTHPAQALLVTAGFSGEGGVVLCVGDTLLPPAKGARKRGGAGRGQGRKPLMQGQRTVSTTVRMPEPLREKYRRLGGAEWMRQALEAASEPAEG